MKTLTLGISKRKEGKGRNEHLLPCSMKFSDVFDIIDVWECLKLRQEGGNNKSMMKRRRIFEDLGDDYNKEEEDDLRNLKVTIPLYRGTTNPDAYIDRERKMELVFDYHNYSDKKKVMLAGLEFSDYALVWWDKL
ncbi:unnamed protein product [Linum trigynum]|uniref:Uncharacterized protein n=1 Tax=Linum trigynum TaxID=586398 RepID=A0AAV2FXW0_9ROSI